MLSVVESQADKVFSCVPHIVVGPAYESDQAVLIDSDGSPITEALRDVGETPLTHGASSTFCVRLHTRQSCRLFCQEEWFDCVYGSSGVSDSCPAAGAGFIVTQKPLSDNEDCEVNTYSILLSPLLKKNISTKVSDHSNIFFARRQTEYVSAFSARLCASITIS